MKRKKRIFIARSLLVIFLFYVAGCNYYKISSHRDQSEIRDEMMQSINADKKFILVQGADEWSASSLRLDDDDLVMDVGILTPSVKKMHETVESRNTKRIKMSTDPEAGYSERRILQEVRIYVDPSVIISKGSIRIPVSSIEQVDIYDKDTGKTSASYFFGALGIVAGVFVIIGIIVALTKSSCPFIYSLNGEGFEFEGESYGGATFSPLERSDYIPLQHIQLFADSCLIRISNELKEKQYINFVEMVNVYTSPDATALIDKYGQVYSINPPVPVLMAKSSGNNDYSKVLKDADGQKFLFNEGDGNTSNLICQFPGKSGAGEAKLVVNAKASLWLDYVYGEFLKTMGGFYPEFCRRQNLRSREELEQWSIDQEIPLKVYLFKNNQWEYIDYFPMVGPLGEPRKMVMKLDLTGLDTETVDLKFETGNMFWEIDYAGLDFSDSEVLKVHYDEPYKATNQDNADILRMISSDDMDYLQQFSIGDYANVRFRVAGNDSEVKLTSILHIKGYYEHIREYNGIPDFVSLMSFKNPGVFTAYSREMYREKENALFPDLISKKSD